MKYNFKKKCNSDAEVKINTHSHLFIKLQRHEMGIMGRE